MELKDINVVIIQPEEEIAVLARRILKVYGEVETPVLDAEIERIAKILNIPLQEVTQNGK